MGYRSAERIRVSGKEGFNIKSAIFERSCNYRIVVQQIEESLNNYLMQTAIAFSIALHVNCRTT